MISAHNPIRRSPSAALLTIVAGSALSASTTARAEGSAQLGELDLRAATELYVDILNDAEETIYWSGDGNVIVSTPSGASMGSFDVGEAITPSAGAGAYRLQVTEDQTSEWDVLVRGTGGIESGRLHSSEWKFNANTYGAEGAESGSVYFLIPVGNDDDTAVIEMRFDGLGGYDWGLGANSTGADGANSRSGSQNVYTFTPEYDIYLNPPEKATYSSPSAVVGEMAITYPLKSECEGVEAGKSEGVFTFDSDLACTYRVTCDLNGDGVYDISSDDDLTLIGDAVAGTNSVTWDGLTNGGDPVDPGSYQCQAMLTVGEVHYVAGDTETCYQGLQMFEVDPTERRSGLRMFWNDSEVLSEDVPLPNGATSLDTSGPTGMASGSYDDSPVANTSARAWGNYTPLGKGNITWLDTYTWLTSTVSGSVTVIILDPDLDANGNGIPDVDEDCEEETVDTAPPDTSPVDPIDTGIAGYYYGGCSSLPGGLPGIAVFGLLGLGVLLRRRRSE
jgi:uncharacterized protein (TIGR03382 family)